MWIFDWLWFIASCVTYVSGAILSSLIGHAILAISRPETFLPTLSSAVVVVQYSALITMAFLFLVGVSFKWKLKINTAARKGTLIGACVVLNIALGALHNVLGVAILKKHDFHGPLLDFPNAARVGAVGGATMAVFVWLEIFLGRKLLDDAEKGTTSESPSVTVCIACYI
jgi:hypothetical protein